MRPFPTSGYHRQLQKPRAKIHFSNRHHLSPRHQRTLFVQLMYSCFSRNLVRTNSIAPFSVYKPYTTHNSSIRSDEGLTLETSAFQSLYGGQFTLSTPLINQIFTSTIAEASIDITRSIFVRSRQRSTTYRLKRFKNVALFPCGVNNSRLQERGFVYNVLLFCTSNKAQRSNNVHDVI